MKMYQPNCAVDFSKFTSKDFCWHFKHARNIIFLPIGIYVILLLFFKLLTENALKKKKVS